MSVEKLFKQVVTYGALVLGTSVVLVAVYLIAKELIGEVPSKIGTVIAGIVAAYIYATKKVVRNKLDAWIKSISKK